MLGITTADAVLIVGLAISLLAAWRGAVAGDAAKKLIPPDPALAAIGGALVDKAALDRNTAAIDRLAASLEKIIERTNPNSPEHQQREILERLDRIEQDLRHDSR